MGEAADATTALSAIAERDAGFDIEAFLSEATDVFLAVERARTVGPVDGVRTAVADSAWSALHLDQPPSGARPRPAVNEPEVVRASTGAIDTIVVRFTANGADGRRVEDWTFQRPSTAHTAASASECPNCGALDSIGVEGRCRYCHVSLTADTWRVTRATSVGTGAPEPVVGKAEIMAAIEEASRTRPAARATSSSRRGCWLGTVVRVLVVLSIAAAGLVGYGWLVPDSAVHERVVSLVPATKRAHLDGTITLAGEVPGTALFATWWESPKSCASLSGSATTLAVSGPADVGGTMAASFRTDGVAFGLGSPAAGTVVITYDNPATAVHQVWENGTATGTRSVVLAGDGSGEASFADLPATLTTPGAPLGPMSGSMRWTCTDR